MTTTEQTIISNAKAAWGKGWLQLSEEQQKAAVCQALVGHLLSRTVTSGSQIEGFQLLSVRTLSLLPTPVAKH